MKILFLFFFNALLCLFPIYSYSRTITLSSKRLDQIDRTTQSIDKNGRIKYNFNLDWLFIQSNPKGASDQTYDDSNWKRISCPHTFNDVDTFDNFCPGHHKGESNQWRGTVWYRKHFTIASSEQNRKIVVEFESVRQIAEVYINGVYLGKNQTGFIPFGYDLTPYIHFGEDNVVAVKVNNDRNDNFRDNFPLVWNHEHWHPDHGGIYRNVYLYSMNPLHITLPLYDNLKTQGTYVYADKVSHESADIHVQSEIINAYAYDTDFVFETLIYNQKNQLINRTETIERIASGKKKMVSAQCQLKEPTLWSTRYPYLYRLVTVIKQHSQVVDSCEVSLGIRYFDFNKDTGFWLNGESIKLHGWGQKPTNSWAGLGAALPDWLRDYTYRLMDEAGGNFIRWGHCAGAPAEIDMGDKYGFVTLMPGVAGESTDMGETWNIRLAAFRDMVIYYRNHPSIFIWEGGNWAETVDHYKELLKVISNYDPNGKRMFGHRRADIVDYSKQFVNIEIGTEGWEREYDDLPIVESEYCRDESPRRIWDKESPDDNFYHHPNISKNTYVESSEDYAVVQVEDWWNKIGKKPYHCGGANWVFSDGPHGGRSQTEVTRASGEVDAVRLPKEAFYALKSMWRPESQVHIIGHWNYTKDMAKTIYVVSNSEEVRLFVNDKLVGKNSQPRDGYLFEFPSVQWKSGTIKAEAYIGDKLVKTQIKKTIGIPVAIKLTPITGPKGWRADGSDIVLIDVEVVDKNGDRCPLAKQRIDFTISGPTIWRGGYNSGRKKSTNNRFLFVECGINRVALRSLITPGVVTLQAEGLGLKSAQINLKTRPVVNKDGVSIEMPQRYEVKATEEPLPIHTPDIPAYVPQESNKSLLFTHFSYTGNAKARLRTNIFWGKRAYTDLLYNYTTIPRYLTGGEYIRMPNADNHYWARDLLQFVAGADMTIYIGHDDRVALPAFIKEKYVDTGDYFKLGDVVMSIYSYEAKRGESIIMAGNSDGDSPDDCFMYVVIAKKKVK